MVASASSPADVVNIALTLIGHPIRVGSLYDGSDAANKALDIYAETRDEVLRSKDWPFALRQVSGSVSAVTVSGWPYVWTYPSDCLRVRQVTPNPIPASNLDPSQVIWSLFNDASAGRLILSQISPVLINYVGRVTDPAQWDPLFVNALAQALATKLLAGLRKGAQPSLDPGAAINAAANADEPLAPNDAAVPRRQQ